jgi:DNA helicase-2/ATP-dependent DNA helicase PcrA
VVDFAELLLRTYELLSRNQPLREHYQARFRHILVDEFQDTNNLQYNWLKLLAGRDNAALFAVGDDDQSIYAFRGANVGNMSAFEREFQVQNLIKLEQNYRSHGHILDAANTLIANNSKRLGKNLRTDAGHGEPVRIYEASSDLQEAQLDHRGKQEPDRRRRAAQRDRGAVPFQRAVAGDRACACSRPAFRTACTAASASSSVPR